MKFTKGTKVTDVMREMRGEMLGKWVKGNKDA